MQLLLQSLEITFSFLMLASYYLNRSVLCIRCCVVASVLVLVLVIRRTLFVD
jgi:hypothetical protein